MTTAAQGLEAVLLDAQNRGFIGPGSVASHRQHAEAFLSLIGEEPGAGVDLGTGGGLPGLVIAVARPTMHWTLVESSVTRARFLEDAVEQLGLDTSVCADRAEIVGRGPLRGTIAVVTARSFGPPGVVAECGAPLLQLHGRLLVSEPPEGEVADRWPADALGSLGLGPAELVPGPPRLVMLQRVGPCPDDAPRRVGLPAKRPRF